VTYWLVERAGWANDHVVEQATDRFFVWASDLLTSWESWLSGWPPGWESNWQIGSFSQWLTECLGELVESDHVDEQVTDRLAVSASDLLTGWGGWLSERTPGWTNNRQIISLTCDSVTDWARDTLCKWKPERLTERRTDGSAYWLTDRLCNWSSAWHNHCYRKLPSIDWKEKLYFIKDRCLMRSATSWKVAGSIPDGMVIGFFNCHNPSSRTMAPESTQPLTEICKMNLSEDKGRSAGE
jgi:hypothetical protein